MRTCLRVGVFFEIGIIMALELQVISDSKQAQKDLAKLRQSVEGIQKTADSSTSSLKNLVSAIVVGGTAIAGFAAFTKISDVVTTLQSKLKLITTNQKDLNLVLQDTANITLNTRQSLDGVSSLYSKIGINADRLGASISDIGQVTQAVAKSLALSGANAQEATATITQLGQALASGRLQGDEMRSVLENAPVLARAIADGLQLSIGQMRLLGQSGQLTSKQVFDAILKQTDQINEKFKNVGITYNQAFTNLGNSGVLLFQAIQKAFSGSSAGVSGASLINNIAVAIGTISANFDAFILNTKTKLLLLFFDFVIFAKDAGNRVSEVFSRFASFTPKIDISLFFPSLDTIITTVKNWVLKVEGWFKYLYDKVIGHSWIPDLIDGIKNAFKELTEDPLGFIGNFANKAISLFKGLFDKVSDFWDELTRGNEIEVKLPNAVANKDGLQWNRLQGIKGPVYSDSYSNRPGKDIPTQFDSPFESKNLIRKVDFSVSDTIKNLPTRKSTGIDIFDKFLPNSVAPRNLNETLADFIKEIRNLNGDQLRFLGKLKPEWYSNGKIDENKIINDFNEKAKQLIGLTKVNLTNNLLPTRKSTGIDIFDKILPNSVAPRNLDQTLKAFIEEIRGLSDTQLKFLKELKPEWHTNGKVDERKITAEFNKKARELIGLTKIDYKGEYSTPTRKSTGIDIFDKILPNSVAPRDLNQTLASFIKEIRGLSDTQLKFLKELKPEWHTNGKVDENKITNDFNERVKRLIGLTKTSYTTDPTSDTSTTTYFFKDLWLRIKSILESIWRGLSRVWDMLIGSKAGQNIRQWFGMKALPGTYSDINKSGQYELFEYDTNAKVGRGTQRNKENRPFLHDSTNAFSKENQVPYIATVMTALGSGLVMLFSSGSVFKGLITGIGVAVTMGLSGLASNIIPTIALIGAGIASAMGGSGVTKVIAGVFTTAFGLAVGSNVADEAIDKHLTKMFNKGLAGIKTITDTLFGEGIFGDRGFGGTLSLLAKLMLMFQSGRDALVQAGKAVLTSPAMGARSIGNLIDRNFTDRRINTIDTNIKTRTDGLTVQAQAAINNLASARRDYLNANTAMRIAALNSSGVPQKLVQDNLISKENFANAQILVNDLKRQQTELKANTDALNANKVKLTALRDVLSQQLSQGVQNFKEGVVNTVGGVGGIFGTLGGYNIGQKIVAQMSEETSGWIKMGTILGIALIGQGLGATLFTAVSAAFIGVVTASALWITFTERLTAAWIVSSSAAGRVVGAVWGAFTATLAGAGAVIGGLVTAVLALPAATMAIVAGITAAIGTAFAAWWKWDDIKAWFKSDESFVNLLRRWGQEFVDMIDGWIERFKNFWNSKDNTPSSTPSQSTIPSTGKTIREQYIAPLEGVIGKLKESSPTHSIGVSADKATEAVLDKLSDVEKLQAYAIEKSKAAGLDPRIILSSFQVESKFNPNVQDNRKSGARGISQITEATAKTYNIDFERLKEPLYSIESGIVIFKDLAQKFKGDAQSMWAGYHSGPNLPALSSGKLDLGKIDPTERPKLMDYLSDAGSNLTAWSGGVLDKLSNITGVTSKDFQQIYEVISKGKNKLKETYREISDFWSPTSLATAKGLEDLKISAINPLGINVAGKSWKSEFGKTNTVSSFTSENRNLINPFDQYKDKEVIDGKEVNKTGSSVGIKGDLSLFPHGFKKESFMEAVSNATTLEGAVEQINEELRKIGVSGIETYANMDVSVIELIAKKFDEIESLTKKAKGANIEGGSALAKVQVENIKKYLSEQSKLAKERKARLEEAKRRGPVSDEALAAGTAYATKFNIDFVTGFSGFLSGKQTLRMAIRGWVDTFTNTVITSFTEGLWKSIDKNLGISRAIGNLVTDIFSFGESGGNWFSNLFKSKKDSISKSPDTPTIPAGIIGDVIKGSTGLGAIDQKNIIQEYKIPAVIDSTLKDNSYDSSVTRNQIKDGFTGLEEAFTDSNLPWADKLSKGIGGIGDIFSGSIKGLLDVILQIGTSIVSAIFGSSTIAGGNGGFLGGLFGGLFGSSASSTSPSSPSGPIPEGFLTAAKGGFAFNGSIQRLAGGLISGPGTGTSDSIFAMVSNGESIINAKSTKKYKNLLAQINNGTIKKFAAGGLVGASLITNPAFADLGSITATNNTSSQATFNINITGDISQQTRMEIQRMIPQIAAGVGKHNYERRGR